MSENERNMSVQRSVEEIAIDIAIRLGFLGLFVYWSLLLIGPFVIVVLWAVILAVAVYPVHFWIKERLGGRSGLASFLITLVGMAIILGPATVLATSIIGSVETLAADLKTGTLELPPPPDSIKDWPLIGEKLSVVRVIGSKGGLI